MANILVLGAGGFGTALSIVLARAGHNVALWDHNSDSIARWCFLGCSDRTEWLKEYPFPGGLQLTSDIPAPADYDWAVVATSMSGLQETLRRIEGTRPVVLLQKGLNENFCSPIEVAESALPNTPVLQFTGAAFARHLVRGDAVGTIVSTRRSERDITAIREFMGLLGPTRVWPVECFDPVGLAVINTLRTVASFLQGVAACFLGDARSTLALVEQGIEDEAMRAAWSVGASERDLDCPKIRRIVRADFALCRNRGSRNFDLGWRLADGESLESALEVIEGTAEAVPSIRVLAAKLELPLDGPITESDWPYLQAAVRLVGGDDVGVCAEELLERRARRFD